MSSAGIPGGPTEEGRTATTVTIFGGEYRLKGGDDPEHVHTVARLVDDRMREVADRQRITSPSRAAILASLNIADELLRERQHHEQWGAAIEARSRELRRLIAAAVGGEVKSDRPAKGGR